jgi:hypothetical protein
MSCMGTMTTPTQSHLSLKDYVTLLYVEQVPMCE